MEFFGRDGWMTLAWNYLLLDSILWLPYIRELYHNVICFLVNKARSYKWASSLCHTSELHFHLQFNHFVWSPKESISLEKLNELRQAIIQKDFWNIWGQICWPFYINGWSYHAFNLMANQFMRFIVYSI